MSLVEGEERAAIPSMSWSSVVGDDTVDVEPDSVDEDAPDPTHPATVDASAETPVSFEMKTLVDDENPAPESPSKPPPPPISFTMGTSTVPDEQSPSPSPQAESIVAQPDPTVPLVQPDASMPDVAPPSLSIPLVSETTTVDPTGDVDPVALPPIVEATPSEPARVRG